MTKVKSLADLKAMREKLQSNLDIREKAENPESLVQIKVAMATCGIAAGAKKVMEHIQKLKLFLNIRDMYYPKHKQVYVLTQIVQILMLQ